MKKEQAIELMKQGKRITHENFLDYEWMTMDKSGTTITLEDGISLPAEEFWKGREHWQWDEGYSIFNK